MIYFCCAENRRRLVKGSPLNGIDYLEVVDREEPVQSQRQRRLRIFFVNPLSLALQALTPANFRIDGGQRTIGIRADAVVVHAADALEIHVNTRGDFSTYTLRVVKADTNIPFPGLDPELASIDFSFKVECPSPFDCKPACVCAAEVPPAPEIDYLAKDYASFRQLVLDRMAALLPDWRERNAADLGITLVEMLAYVGDHLSYRQDAIATEAYLGTALQRVSVRRHARLVDYKMHDGCNARVWVQVRLANNAPAGGITLPRLRVETAPAVWTAALGEPVPARGLKLRRTQFLTRVRPGGPVLDESEYERLVPQHQPAIFEPLHDARLFSEHNEMHFHTWSDERCSLPRGAVRATLDGAFPNLARGDVLIFAEQIGPLTGEPADADPRHRHAVRLTSVRASVDQLDGRAVTEIMWAPADALPFPLCLSSVREEDGVHLRDVSIALGNIVLADHGGTLGKPEAIGTVPSANPVLALVGEQSCGPCGGEKRASTPARIRFRLKEGPLTQAAPVARKKITDFAGTRLVLESNLSAAALIKGEFPSALPAALLGDTRGVPWKPQLDLLTSDFFAPEFIAEIENDGRATIRFGDDENGMRPGEDTEFFATYRVGNGRDGNIGADSLAHLADVTLLTNASFIEAVTNPLSARGGVGPETLDETRQYAPAAFRVPQRAVTPEDYATMSGRHPEVQHTAATLRWTGSWHTVFLTVDRLGGQPVDAPFESDLRAFLERYRMAGHDLEIDGPRQVALELALLVCVEPHYFRSDVLAALREVFSNRTQPDGARGFFHPDNFSFGGPVYLSAIFAAAQAVAGVRHVDVITLQRLGTPSDAAIQSGALSIGRLEIARLDNDPNMPERGVLRFEMKGGR
jgi:hypothetical protein